MVHSHPLMFYFSPQMSVSTSRFKNTLLLYEESSKEEERNLDEIKGGEGETEQGPVVNTDYSLPTRD